MTPVAARLSRALVPILLALPASPRAEEFRASPPPPETPDAEVARARFEPPAFDLVLRRAVRALQQDGYELDACDADRGSLVTRPREFDAPCGSSTCLARQSVSVLLGYRAARVTVVREVFDPTVKGWIPANRERFRTDAEEIVRTIVSRGAQAVAERDSCPAHDAREAREEREVDDPEADPPPAQRLTQVVGSQMG
jgi:hypothetical protein